VRRTRHHRDSFAAAVFRTLQRRHSARFTDVRRLQALLDGLRSAWRWSIEARGEKRSGRRGNACGTGASPAVPRRYIPSRHLGSQCRLRSSSSRNRILGVKYRAAPPSRLSSSAFTSFFSAVPPAPGVRCPARPPAEHFGRRARPLTRAPPCRGPRPRAARQPRRRSARHEAFAALPDVILDVAQPSNQVRGRTARRSHRWPPNKAA
jgi:hypothetical protein